MAFNNFLSTSRSRDISISFARQSNLDLIAVLFMMTIDPKVCEQSAISFVDVRDEGYFKNSKEEILFATHCVFRIQRINMIKDAKGNPMWEVHLTLVGENDQEMGELTRYMRKEMGSLTGWSRLGEILIKVGHAEKAKELYQMLLDKASSDTEHGLYFNQLGSEYDDMSEYSKALSCYERALEIYKVVPSPNHPTLATLYNNLGTLYDDMGEYSKALLSHERSLEMKILVLPPNHPSLSTSYNNIGLTFHSMGEHSKALSSYERALEVYEVVLPPNHPYLAACYCNIATVYNEMGEYSRALSFHEQSLEIRKVALPPNHPDFAQSYNSIGMVYKNMGEASKALSYLERAQNIDEKVLPSSHSDQTVIKISIEPVKRNLR